MIYETRSINGSSSSGRTGGGVETVFAIGSAEEREGDVDVVGKHFVGLPKECIMEALKVLEGMGRCEVFGDEDDEGVKFY